MFIDSLFTIAKIWNQPVSINRLVDKEDVVCIYTHNGILPRHKRESNSAIGSDMDGPRGYYA